MKSLLAIFSDYTFQVVALGSAILGIISGVIGSFSVLRKQSLLGDGIAHSSLPGVVLAFILTGNKNIEVLLLGALIAGLLATACIVNIVKNSTIKFDSALALILSVFFGLGMVLLTYVQKKPNSNQAGLDRFLFGQASTMLKRDVILMIIVGIFILTIVFLFWKELKLFAFDDIFAETIGFSTKKLNTLLTLLTVLGIIVGLQTVGVVLMSSLLIAPAVAARQWTNKLWVMVSLAAVFGGISGVIGTFVSSTATKIPTGPVIVVAISIIVLISVLFAPQRGILSTLLHRRKAYKQIRAERGL